MSTQNGCSPATFLIETESRNTSANSEQNMAESIHTLNACMYVCVYDGYVSSQVHISALNQNESVTCLIQTLQSSLRHKHGTYKHSLCQDTINQPFSSSTWREEKVVCRI